MMTTMFMMVTMFIVMMTMIMVTMVMMTVMTLNGAVVPDQSGNIATLTVTGTATATGSIDANGTVTYSDGSFQSLPAGIF